MMEDTNNSREALNPSLLRNSSSACCVSSNAQQRLRPAIGARHQCQVLPYKPIVAKFDLNISCYANEDGEDEGETDSMDVEERAFAYGLSVPLMLIQTTQQADAAKSRTAVVSSSRSSACSVDTMPTTEEVPCPVPVQVKVEFPEGRSDTLQSCLSDENAQQVSEPSTDQRDGTHVGGTEKVGAAICGSGNDKRVETVKKRRRRRAGWKRVKKVKAKRETSMSKLNQASEETSGSNQILVPGTMTCPWDENDVKAFTVGLYLFGKDFYMVKTFVGQKDMQDVLHFYYSKFHGSASYRRWLGARRNRGRCVNGSSLVTGWRQEQLLDRLSPSVLDTAKSALAEDVQSFNSGRMSFEDFVFRLKATAGLGNLVLAIGLGSGKQDLTGGHMDPTPSRLEIPAGKACSNLTKEEVVAFLTGDCRMSKARAQNLFLEAVWPRLLARGWQSEEMERKVVSSRRRSTSLFLVPNHKFSQGSSVKGVDYFTSVSEVLNLVAKTPEWLENPGIVSVDSTLAGTTGSLSQQELSASCHDEITDSETTNISPDPALEGQDKDCRREDKDTCEGRVAAAGHEQVSGEVSSSLSDQQVSCQNLLLYCGRKPVDGKDEPLDEVYTQAIMNLGQKASQSLLRSLASPQRALQRPSASWCQAGGIFSSMLSLYRECTVGVSCESAKLGSCLPDDGKPSTLSKLTSVTVQGSSSQALCGKLGPTSQLSLKHNAPDYESVKREPMVPDEVGNYMVELLRGAQVLCGAYNHDMAEVKLEEPEELVRACKRQRIDVQPSNGPLFSCCSLTPDKFSTKRCFQELHFSGSRVSSEARGSPEEAVLRKSESSASNSDDVISLASQQLMVDFVHLLSRSPLPPAEDIKDISKIAADSPGPEAKDNIPIKGKRSKRHMSVRQKAFALCPLDLEEELLLENPSSKASQVSPTHACSRDSTSSTKLRRRRTLGIGRELEDSELTPPCKRPCFGTMGGSKLADHSTQGDLLFRRRSGSSKHDIVNRPTESAQNVPVHDTRFSAMRRSPCSVAKEGHQVVATSQKQPSHYNKSCARGDVRKSRC